MTNCPVTKALSIAHEEPTYRSLIDRFAAVAFMGTPHGGSGVASWTTLGARLLNALSLGTRTNKELLECLRKDSPLLTLLSLKFAVQSQFLRILSFYETEKFPMMSCRVSGLVISLSDKSLIRNMCSNSGKDCR